MCICVLYMGVCVYSIDCVYDCRCVCALVCVYEYVRYKEYVCVYVFSNGVFCMSAHVYV